MEQVVKQFFEKYERANASSDFKTIAALYADTFMFGGPAGVQAVSKEAFLNLVPKMKAHFQSMGVCETGLKSVEVIPINSKYLLVKVGWTMTVRNTAGERKFVDTFASYVMEQDGTEMSIVFQIDHQDLAATIARQQHQV
jgi:ketosteroid isomerase-like protein